MSLECISKYSHILGHLSSDIWMLQSTVQPTAPRLFHNERVWWHLRWDVLQGFRKHAKTTQFLKLISVVSPDPMSPCSIHSCRHFGWRGGTCFQRLEQSGPLSPSSPQRNEVTRLQTTHTWQGQMARWDVVTSASSQLWLLKGLPHLKASLLSPLPLMVELRVPHHDSIPVCSDIHVYADSGQVVNSISTRMLSPVPGKPKAWTNQPQEGHV